jgi:hypothetical protein
MSTSKLFFHSQEVEARNGLSWIIASEFLIRRYCLTSFGVKLGTKEESYIIHAIKERMNRHLRSAVERVISRLKRHLPLEKPRVKPFEKVRKHVFFCILSMLSLAFTAKKRGKLLALDPFQKSFKTGERITSFFSIVG